MKKCQSANDSHLMFHVQIIVKNKTYVADRVRGIYNWTINWCERGELGDWTMLQSSDQKLCLVIIKFKYVQRHPSCNIIWTCFNSWHNYRQIRVAPKINLKVICIGLKVHIMSSYNFTERRQYKRCKIQPRMEPRGTLYIRSDLVELIPFTQPNWLQPAR